MASYHKYSTSVKIPFTDLEIFKRTILKTKQTVKNGQYFYDIISIFISMLKKSVIYIKNIVKKIHFYS